MAFSKRLIKNWLKCQPAPIAEQVANKVGLPFDITLVPEQYVPEVVATEVAEKNGVDKEYEL